MGGVQEISILTVHVEEVLEHAEYKTWDRESFAEEGSGTELCRDGNKQGYG